MATKVIAWTYGTGNITFTYTGQGNGTIQVTSDPNPLGSARSQVITVETTQGGVVTKNLTINQAACPFPVGDIKNFSYTGDVQSVLLPAGSYKLQCWGAQGGSNAAASSYGITAKAGGKGGYSEGVLTLSSPTTVYIFVGGKGGSSGNGGWNGGGGGDGTTQFNANNTFGYTKVGCGGGATDIALTSSSMSYSSYRTNRSSASLLSRIIVAGGGSGGAMCYTAVTTTTTSWTKIATLSLTFNSIIGDRHQFGDAANDDFGSNVVAFENGKTYKIECSNKSVGVAHRNSSNTYLGVGPWDIASGTSFSFSKINSTDTVQRVVVWDSTSTGGTATVNVYRQDTSSSTTTSNNSQVGYVGGGTTGGGYSSTYQGKQNAAGSNGTFGLGSNQRAVGNRYTAGCGGGGWYGGGSDTSDSPDTYIKYSGGGSGWVNTAASAGYRPSGYTGVELDSGETRDGATSFPNTAGTGNETGHSGDGYCKITRLA